MEELSSFENDVEGIFSEIPLYRDGAVSGVFDCNDRVQEVYITGTGQDAMMRYEQDLTVSGYELVRENAILENRYVIYRHPASGQDLFLQYTAQEHLLRLLLSPETVLLPETPERGERVCSTLLTMLAIGDLGNGENNGAEAFGVSFVIRLEDGRFIVLDGGTNLPTETERLYRTLVRLHGSEDGIVIAAWILTHPDGDHWGCFFGFSEAYAHRVKLEKILYNIFHHSVESGMRPAACGAGDRVHDVYVPRIAENLDCSCLVKLHTGQRFYIGNILFEVLYTHEDLYPVLLSHTNDASIVLKMTIGDTTFLLPADIEGAGVHQLNEQCGSYLKSDYVQVIHHGWRGNSKAEIDFNKPYYRDFYELADARFALWSAQLDDFHYQLLLKADETVPGSVNWLRTKVERVYSTKDGDQTFFFD